MLRPYADTQRQTTTQCHLSVATYSNIRGYPPHWRPYPLLLQLHASKKKLYNSVPDPALFTLSTWHYRRMNGITQYLDCFSYHLQHSANLLLYQRVITERSYIRCMKMSARTDNNDSKFFTNSSLVSSMWTHSRTMMFMYPYGYVSNMGYVSKGEWNWKQGVREGQTTLTSDIPR